MLTNCEEAAKELSTFFVNAVKNCDYLVENINDPTLKGKDKWRNHPSILAIAYESENRVSFSFSFVSKEEVLAEIKALFYFIIRFQIPRDYFEVNAGHFQISSMRDISVSTHG